MGLNAMADGTTQTVKVDGNTIDKTVVKITFNGDNAVLNFSDNTQQTVELEAVSIDFAYSTAIDRVAAENENGKAVYNLQGQRVGTGTAGLQKGVYIIDGKKVIIK